MMLSRASLAVWYVADRWEQGLAPIALMRTCRLAEMTVFAVNGLMSKQRFVGSIAACWKIGMAVLPGIASASNVSRKRRGSSADTVRPRYRGEAREGRRDGHGRFPAHADGRDRRRYPGEGRWRRTGWDKAAIATLWSQSQANGKPFIAWLDLKLPFGKPSRFHRWRQPSRLPVASSHSWPWRSCLIWRRQGDEPDRRHLASSENYQS